MRLMIAMADADGGDGDADSFYKIDHTSQFKDPLGVKDPLSAAAEEDSDEFDFDVCL